MDDVVRQMELDDKLDAAHDGITKMTVIEYARARGLQPQNLYYHVRVGNIKQEVCICGRKVIDVAGADAFLAEREQKRTGIISLESEA